jgi:hypothetical protein
MKYDKYIVSFVPGSSGRFVKSLLDRIIMGSSNPIELCPYNSSHLDKTFMGIATFHLHIPDVYSTFAYANTPKLEPYSKILHSHVYPDFETINKRFDNVGIILIKFEHDDAKEIAFNIIYKNKKEILPPITLELGNNHIVNVPKYKKFLCNDDYPKNCLVLRYKEIYETVGEKYRILETLKEFTGIDSIPKHLNIACEQYISNRTKIINQYNLR